MAIGNKIADYLIKPVNPNQILMTLKKHIHKKEIISEQTTVNYQSEFAKIGAQISESLTHEEWSDLYRKLVYWELTLDEAENRMQDLLAMQKTEANGVFAKYIKKNYPIWFENPEMRPMMSPDIFKKKIFPLIDNDEKVFFVVIDNFRLDQWWLIKELLDDYYTIEDDELYYSILPTATQYARNAIFSGLMPLQIEELFPDLWIGEEDEEIKTSTKKNSYKLK